MFHFVYKTTSTSGKFYVGRHSTNNLEDGYLGSGVWIKQIKNKETLTKEILCFADSFDELLILESKILNEVFEDPNNMNYHKSCVGFACGDLNPARTDKERERRSKHNWMKTPEGRKWFSENNPNKSKHVRDKKRTVAIQLLESGEHNFCNPDSISKKNQTAKLRFTTDNPAKKLKNKDASSKRAKLLIDNDDHNFQKSRAKCALINKDRLLKDNPMKRPEVIEKRRGPKPLRVCPHCGKEGSNSGMTTYHFDNCKHKSQEFFNHKY